ncbi:MAG: GyrI-like domain-containing protein [Oscillospiraceae bacterium]|nr:GyrI-like domain-containing protein [Oscillospiraceae bacterium]
MAFDFQKEYRELYQPQNRPEIVTVPPANYIAVRGRGDPNEKGGEYQRAVGILYAVAYTLRMSPRSGRRIDGFFEYVVPPLEGFWYQEGVSGVDYGRKADFCWVSVIRLPDFVTQQDFDWAVETAAKKKKLDCSKAELLFLDEGLCVQMMHLGVFDEEPATVEKMDAFLWENGYENDMDGGRMHHEIYLSDPRKTAPEKQRTVIRHPIRRAAGKTGAGDLPERPGR